MQYYEVGVNSSKYQGRDALTYASSQPLKEGAVVVVPLRQAHVLGVVLHKTSRTGTFRTKPISRILPIQLPSRSLELLNWCRQYYPAGISSHVSLFLPQALMTAPRIKARETRTAQPSTLTEKPYALPHLTTEQQTALKTINKHIQSHERTTIMLHGRTGSGKTRIYLELAKQTLADNRSVLVLTPEIGLTSPLATFFRAHIQQKVILIHSGITPAVRRDRWLEALDGDNPKVIIGPRSALFTPLRNIGLIVIDEAHDGAYKQDQLPRYQTLRVAGTLAAIHSATLIMGSATPLVSDYYLMEAKGLPIIRLLELAAGTAAPPQIEIVSSRDRDHFSTHPYLSNQLITAVHQALKEKRQVLLFLNRRGTAQLVVCQNCGWQALCPRCDIPLTYHGDTHHMQCHTCGLRQEAPAGCPKCSSADILFKSAGTKAIETYAQKLFPEATIRRFDTDNRRVESLEQSFEEIKSGKINILIGTQILAKGLDLPLLGTVGVLAADTGLYFPDYTAEEQTYQLLSQVIGRVNRGHTPGKVVIQTFMPDNSILSAAIKDNWQSFYKAQIDERKRFLFPPFCFILKLSVARKSKPAAARACQAMVVILQDLHLKQTVIQGPAPRFIERAGGKYHQQIIVKAKDRSELLKIIPRLPSGWHYDLDPLHLL